MNTLPVFASATYYIANTLTLGFITQNNIVMEFGIDGNKPGTRNTLTSNANTSISINGKQNFSDDANIIITQYAVVGEKVIRSVTGSYIRHKIKQTTGQVTTFNVTITNSSFELFRNPDSQ